MKNIKDITSISGMMVAYATRNIVPPLETFGSKTISIAVTVPGGFTGFGPTPTEACKMAMSLAHSSYAHARLIFGVERDLSEKEWLHAMMVRMTPGLASLYRDALERAKKPKEDACTNPIVESEDMVNEVRKSKSPPELVLG